MRARFDLVAPTLISFLFVAILGQRWLV